MKFTILPCFAAAILLTGCQSDFRSSMDDYTGSDTAKIRVIDSGVLSATSYEKTGDCYKGKDPKKLTSAFRFSLLDQADTSVSAGKTVNMQPSVKFSGKTANEYIVKAEEILTITNRTQTESYNGQTSYHTQSISFTPAVGHEYEIHVEKSQHLNFPTQPVVDDLTAGTQVVSLSGINFCKKEGFSL